MRVLGFDPGTATTGFGIVQRTGTKLTHICHGTILTPPDISFADRLLLIFEDATRLISQHKPEKVAIEKLYFVRNITTGIGVAQARGVIALAAAKANLPISEYTPLEVKNAVVGYGKANKRQVQEMVRVLLSLKDIPRPDDASDALALAICCLHDYRETAR